MSALDWEELRRIASFLEERYREEESWAHERKAQDKRDAEEHPLRIKVHLWASGIPAGAEHPIVPASPWPAIDDPARILAEVAAKRAAVAALTQGGCSWCDVNDNLFADELRALAAVYVGHRLYREEWK